MSHVEDPSIVCNYQFPRWSTTLSRSQSNSQSKDTVNDIFQLGIDNRNPFQKSELSTTKRIIHHHVRIPTTSRYISASPIDQANSISNHNTTLDRSTPTSINSRHYRHQEQSFQNFSKQTHEKRKITYERKRKKQQAQTLVEKYSDTETWFQLGRSVAELKRLATTQEILVDPSTSIFNCDGHLFSTLKQIIAQQQEDKKAVLLKSELGISSSSSFGSALSSGDLNRGSAATSHSSCSRPGIPKQPTETYPRFILIADEEHRIENWYHQYPFILADHLLTLFESKQLQQKSTISAHFIDDLELSKTNITAKTFLQGKPFHINND
ncbi:unnamed protein product [Rotaria sordida]|uniref:Uncharacterized protein n=1 Tax=Rotaria sordida TaxID=392033 RepID=A0A815RNJ2_9BILA|nr:unnamed protein product [Rotaria sordida]